jgi:hypothetical protein
MEVQMTIVFELDDNVYGNTEDELLWLENEILVGNRTLILHSNEIGDSLGEITSVKNLKLTNNGK